jgi:hypothetical protein
MGVFGLTQADQFEVGPFPNRGLEARLFVEGCQGKNVLSRPVADWPGHTNVKRDEST